MISSLLPHRPPFLFLDSVVELEKVKRSYASDMFQLMKYTFRHFEDLSFQVLMIEAVAQAGGVLCRKSFDGDFSNFILSEVQESRFKRMIVLAIP